MSAYCRWILKLREAFENEQCGRFVRLLPVPEGRPNPWAAIETEVPSSLRQTASMRKRHAEAKELRASLARSSISRGRGGRPPLS